MHSAFVDDESNELSLFGNPLAREHVVIVRQNDLFGGVVPSFHGDILSLQKGASGLSSTVAHFKGISAEGDIKQC